MMILGIIVVVLALIIIACIKMYNGFVRGDNGCQEAFSTMDVYLKKRFDLIPNLVETVKGYAKHESETLEAVVKARAAISGAGTQEEKMAGEAALSGTLKSLFAVAEGYPELKANENFKTLMAQLQTVEEDIAQSRKYYNALVKKFNIKCEAFPTSLIAKQFGYSKKPLYEISEGERENIKVDFTGSAAGINSAPTEANAAKQADTVKPADGSDEQK